jgi:hypothetical protein
MNNKHNYLNKPISREGDLAPKGIKSTVGKDKYSFNEVFGHIFNQIKNVKS